MITLDSVSFGYSRDEPIIEDFDLTLPAGSSTAVTGPSGRGKSTLLYLIGLLLTPWSGEIRFAGEEMAHWGDLRRSQWRASRVGFVFQDAALDPSRTVLDNIVESAVYNRTPRRDAVGRARALMQRFGVALRADHKPGEVSGGQAQRIALCRALLSNPDLILADEPTGNLDNTSAEIVLDWLFAAADEGKTVIFATHDQRIIDRCQQAIKL